MKVWCFVVMGALFLATVGPVRAAGGGESAELSAKRREMQHRERRLIYNNDSGDIFAAGANTPEGFLAVRMKPALGTQVDSVFYCTGATTMFSHLAKVGEVYGKQITEASGDEPRNVPGNIRGLAEAGTDALALVVKFCHENKLEVFFTHRINDVHDSFLDWELTTWKREHPEYLMGKREDFDRYPDADPRHWWSSLDYEVPEVRDYLLAIIDDVLARYDVDGIEIDYFRSPMFFRPNLTFAPATAEEVEILTGFQRRVRELAYEHGNGRGRPILVATRTPMTKATCLHVGIDIEGWMKEGLLDVLTTGGGYIPFTMPTGELVDLGHQHGVPVYPAISASGMQNHGAMEYWRGAAANAWQAGADGIYLFNVAPSTPNDPHFTELGDPKALAGMDKVFVVDNMPVLSGMLVQGIEESQILPKEVDSSGKERVVVVPVGDDIAGAEKAGKLAGAGFRVQFGGKAPGDAVEVQVNGTAVLAKEEGSEGWVTYDVDPSTWRRGDNAVSFRVTSRAGGEGIVVKAIELNADYR